LATLIAIAVVEHQGRFLIGQRPPGVPLAGLWEFPGGKVQADESAEQAAVRECFEETGLGVSVVSEYPQQLQQYDHDCVQLRFFRCELVDPHVEPLAPYRWVERKELGSYQFPEGNRAILKLLLS